MSELVEWIYLFVYLLKVYGVLLGIVYNIEDIVVNRCYCEIYILGGSVGRERYIGCYNIGW